MTEVSSGLGEKKRPAVFFDRDGVVNVSPGHSRYVLSWEVFDFSPGIFEALALVKKRGYLAILVTSQKGVGKGLMSPEDLDDIHRRMQESLRATSGFEMDGIYAYTASPDCPHQPKPDPEMILTAAAEHGIDLEWSWLIGDADRDIEMGIAAGLKGTIRVISENGIGVEADVTIGTVLEAVAVFDQVL